METQKEKRTKTTVILENDLLSEIDYYNPFSTRREFLDKACKLYLRDLKRRKIDEDLAAACAEAAQEDAQVNEEWESASLENWK
jgi:hypothetical protein